MTQRAILDCDGILCCPHCGGNNLHHSTVEVFNRPREDDPSTAVLVKENGAPIVGHPLSNPSGRRNGILIEFKCENCGFDNPAKVFALGIVQHKGNTFLSWFGVV